MGSVLESLRMLIESTEASTTAPATASTTAPLASTRAPDTAKADNKKRLKAEADSIMAEIKELESALDAAGQAVQSAPKSKSIRQPLKENRDEIATQLEQKKSKLGQ